MTRVHAVLHAIAVAGALTLTGAAPSRALDLTGAWATDMAVCNKVFAKKGGAVSFKKDSELHGSGFIIEGDRIRGPVAQCTIKSRKEDGAVIHLLAACASDIMLSSVQFTVMAVDDNTLTRVFPGMEGMEVSYHRCRF